MLKTRDAHNRETLALDQTIVKFMGVASVGGNYTGGAQSGTLTDSRFTQYPGCVPYVMVVDGTIDIGGYTPTLTIRGNTLTWYYRVPGGNHYSRVNTTFIYGIF